MKLSLKRNYLNAVATLPASFSLAIILTFSLSDAYGDIFVTASESEAGTTIRWSGSLDLTDLESAGSGVAPEGSIFPKMGMLSGSSKKMVDVYYFNHLQLRPFGNGGGVLQTSGRGDCLLLTNTMKGNGLCVCLPGGYTGGPIAGEITFAGASLESLGIDPSYPFAYDLGGQYIAFFFEPEAFEASKPIRRKLTQVLPSQDQKVQLKRFFFKRKPKSRRFSIRTSDVPMVKVRPLNR